MLGRALGCRGGRAMIGRTQLLHSAYPVFQPGGEVVGHRHCLAGRFEGGGVTWEEATIKCVHSIPAWRQDVVGHWHCLTGQ